MVLRRTKQTAGEKRAAADAADELRGRKPGQGRGPTADELNQVAATVRDYVRMESTPWPASLSAREQAQEQDVAALPFTHPADRRQLRSGDERTRYRLEGSGPTRWCT